MSWRVCGGADHAFLPGGHIEIGEAAETALVRELREEIGTTARVARFLGAVEHTWAEAGVRQFEINLVFEAELPGLDATRPPAVAAAAEAHLGFRWSDVRDLHRHNLQPTPVIECITADPSRTTAFWGSTLDD